MENKYNKYINEWNNIFSNEEARIPTKLTCGNDEIDKGISWISKGTSSIVDFGCGNGTALFLCAMNGTKSHIGFDLSEKAIENAKKSASKMTTGEFTFIKGGIESLRSIDDKSIDSVILFNIIDNLYEDDAERLLSETFRILNKNGKVLVKLNDFVTDKQVNELDIKVIKDELLDDGLLLLNKTTEEWISFFESKFFVSHYRRVYYEEFNQYNRIFYLTTP